MPEPQETTTKQKLKFPKDAKRILSDELRFFSEFIIPGEEEQLSDMLALLRDPAGAEPTLALNRTMEALEPGILATGEERGIRPELTGGILDFLRELGLDSRERLVDLAENVGEGTRSLIDPRFARFLAPTTETTQTTGTDDFGTGLAIAGILANAGGLAFGG